MGVKRCRENVIKFTSQGLLLSAGVIIASLFIYIRYFNEVIHTPLWSIGIPIVVFLNFIWWRIEKQGTVLDLNERVIKFKPDYFIALFKPFAKLQQKTVSLDEIIGASLNFDVNISSDNKITKFYSVNISGTFGAKDISFMTRETAQSLYSMIASACNLH
ncbi:hypothetical protein [Treponema putidum]|uniref:hypothetical protein n=1 Tax=Treponema putidum TaxID=221027 RepID=UPI002105073C|nr:hypothetical protein [Treponema putidum]